jgi:hypothetical protein
MSNTVMKNSSPVLPSLIFGLTTAHSADVTGPYFGQKSPACFH